MPPFALKPQYRGILTQWAKTKVQRWGFSGNNCGLLGYYGI